MEILKMASLRRVLATVSFIFGILGIYVSIVALVWGMHECGIIDITALSNYQNYRL